MSNRYKGAVISATPPTTSGPYEYGTASGVWTLEQQMQAIATGTWPLAGNVPQYIEDVFSTYLYTGNNSTQTITNGIDLSTKGGLVWVKNRTGTYHHTLWDTVRGVQKYLYTSATNTESTDAGSLTAFNSNGFSLGNSDQNWNNSASSYVSWTFREQPKFFDIVTWTGTGSNTTIAHNLGSVPGCIMVKRLDAAANWAVYHRSLANTQYLVLNDTAAAVTGATWWNSTTPTSSVFSVGTDATVNASGGTYIAYIFAHDAGGFGLTGTDNVISCGSFTSTGAGGCDVTLGYEPQIVIYKNITANEVWRMADVMRGWSQTQLRILNPNSTAVEASFDNNPSYLAPTSTGFNTPTPGLFTPSQTFVYIAIRRGPMKVPTLGTSVFSPNAVNVSGGTTVTTGFPVDWQINYHRTVAANYNSANFNRLRGVSSDTTESGQIIWTAKADAEASFTGTLGWDNTGFKQTTNLFPNVNNIYWNFGRAPGFFDVVCYTGTGSTRTVTHNLGVTPELVITKSRSQALGWVVWTTSLTSTDYWIRLDDTMAQANSPVGYGGTFSASNYTIANTGPYGALNTSAATYVAYLFATCPGVSKVGSYTGTGTTLQINCGFTGGSRFVLIKRTDSTGGWYVWDSARGIVAGNDPYLLLNSTDADVTGTDYVDTAATGFEISSTAPAAINANGGTYIFLAIA